jgi:hypothetical protein
MSPESLLAEKLTSYRGAFDKACRELFSGGEGVTLEYEQDDDDDAVDVSATGKSEPAFENSNRGSNSAKAIREAVRWIADDFAHEFNAKLAAAAKSDPTVELVADKYEMGPGHVDELDALLAAPVQSLLDKLAAGDLDGARRATLEAWPALEKRIRSKWQAYFVLTFQDVSVERKAARDRKKHQSRFDPATMDALAKAESMRRSMSDFAGPIDDRRARTAWIYVAAVLLLALAGGWLLLHHHAH